MSGGAEPTPKTAIRGGAAGEVLAAFLRLGLTSFGGPIAHLGYFHDEFVVRRRWLDEKTYVDLVALSQFLPGPASTKVGIAIGLSRAGYLGAFAAWAGFTLPSALLLVLFGYGVASFGDALRSGWLHGLMVAAVAVVAQAVLLMMRALAPDRTRATLAVAAAAVVLAVPSSFGQIGAIVLGGIAGFGLPARDHARRARQPAAPGEPARGDGGDRRVLRPADRLAAPGRRRAEPRSAPVRRVLSRRLPRVRRRPRGASFAAGRGRAAGLGRQRRFPRRLWRRAGSTRPAVHVLRLSRHRDGAAAEWMGRSDPLSRRHVPAGLPARHRPVAVLGRPAPADLGAGDAARRQRRRGRLAACRSLPSGVDVGHHQSPADFALGIAAFLLLFMWKTPPWLVVAFCAIGGQALTLFPFGG